MHNRQSGAAHVPIMFFILLLMMFFGALGFGWVQQTNNAELRKDVAQAQADLGTIQSKEALIQDYIADIGKVINKPGPYLGRGGNAEMYNGATIDYAGLMDPKVVKQVMDDAATNAGVSQATSLEDLLGAMITRINTTSQRVRDIELERDKALEDKSTGDQRYTALEGQAATAASENSTNLEQARSDFQSATDDRDSRIAQLTQNLRNKDEQMTTLREEFTAKEKDLLGRIARLQTQNSALVEREALRQPPNVADGRVLVAKNGIPKAFINLGRKDLLQPGTVFRVQSPNDDSVKGYCRVTRVEDERAEVRLFDFADPIGNYASEGDLLYNDLDGSLQRALRQGAADRPAASPRQPRGDQDGARRRHRHPGQQPGQRSGRRLRLGAGQRGVQARQRAAGRVHLPQQDRGSGEALGLEGEPDPEQAAAWPPVLVLGACRERPKLGDSPCRSTNPRPATPSTRRSRCRG
jgi:hypothetical protein